MFKIFKRTSLFIATLALMFGSCNNNKDDVDSNPTNGRSSAKFNSEVTYGTLTDQEGNIYKTVTIGTQTWMAENLRTTTYNDGSAIPLVADSAEWSVLTSGAYSVYNNCTAIDTIATFGCLYNWYAVNTGKLAPEGWHVPADTEWEALINYLGGPNIAGGKLKEAGTVHWAGPNTGATNETGFTALPGGERFCLGEWYNFGFRGYWWSTTPVYNDQDFAWGWRMFDIYRDIASFSGNKGDGISVRCLKD